MADAPSRGLFRRTPTGVWHARRAVPKDLREQFGWERIVSLETKDSRQAERRRDDFWRQCDVEFEQARAAGGGPLASLEQVLAAIECWRKERCAASMTGVTDEPLTLATGMSLPGSAFQALSKTYEIDPGKMVSPEPRLPKVGPDAQRVAAAYFDANPDASRDLSMPFATALLIGKLQAAARDPHAWEQLAGFDSSFGSAVEAGGLKSPVPPTVRVNTRTAFAIAWLDVVQHQEWQRQRAAVFMAAANANRADPRDLKAEAARNAYVPREDDHSLRELIDAYRKDRESRHGEESTGRKYEHIFRCLEEVLDPGKPIRAITRADARKLKETLRAMPAHMSKRYPKLSIADAIEAAEEDDAELLAPNSVNSYLANLTAMMNWAIREEWLETNPAKGLVDKSLPRLQRRGFTPEELRRIFDGLAEERAKDSWKFWLPILGMFTGARLNELCQLHVQDIGHADGIHYLKISEFDATGRRADDKHVKTQSSARNVPLHPHLVELGFLKLIRGSNHRRVFAELRRGPGGNYSHDASRWFGSFMNKIGLTDPALVFHSFRHGFRDACRLAGIPDEVAHALGGWAATSVGQKYGDRGMLPLLDREIRKIEFVRL